MRQIQVHLIGDNRIKATEMLEGYGCVLTLERPDVITVVDTPLMWVQLYDVEVPEEHYEAVIQGLEELGYEQQ